MNKIKFHEINFFKIFLIIFSKKFYTINYKSGWINYSKSNIEIFTSKDKNKIQKSSKNINIQSDYYPMN